ncbi:beta-glucosidase [Dactylosporangium aurantiacum]|uniref:Beta-glucosidase n=1 Tax=Dactylosporangium aurantiacum TaxID=35754 RepID=A0A9Q9MG53_9ACTN|nr:GH1 family beta-glucosidase [Dactylosporangium aurantiacum]MDG6102319.1 GH1 family beta-glucosidase [Dactylosporangium aurantiacum]UWZ53380.1 beta-glucosidase [Dactylosporangium aurantiacum]
MSDFPTGFQFGVSTAAYQIEGAVDEDGRGPSIWDTFSRTPGTTRGGATGDVACDHYHRWESDLDLIQELGATAYRCSVAWPRVQPTGEGPANAAGLAFYDRLVDGMLTRGIDPVVTLFHWDLPQALQDRGGWADRDTAMRFGEYAELVGEALGDRVKLWVTLNEPYIHLVLGHVLGIHAPGLRLGMDLLPVIHHQLLGHGLAVSALRRVSTAPVTLANNYSPVWPKSDAEDDQTAAMFYDLVQNRLFTDPVLLGEYPPIVEGLTGGADIDSIVLDGDLRVISQPIDALGVNYYNPSLISAPLPGEDLPFSRLDITGYPTTDFGWPVVPSALRDLLVTLRGTYGDRLPPIWITESGCSYAPVDDQFRIDYHAGHLDAVREAIAAGVDVRGYCAWSLLDNFEWAEGYDQRFGLVHVDFTTQERTRRASFDWFRRVCTSAAPRPDLQGGPTG